MINVHVLDNIPKQCIEYALSDLNEVMIGLGSVISDLIKIHPLLEYSTTLKYLRSVDNSLPEVYSDITHLREII